AGLGRPRVHHRLTDSTNERARALALAGAPHGTLVTAEEQSSGRGRQGRRWEAPPGTALLASLVVRDLDERHAVLPLTAAVATCEACEAVAAVECRIKWPNDVWVKRRKVAGILLEGRPQEGWAVIGVGINVSTRAEELPAGLRAAATSLAAAPPIHQEPPEPETVLEALLNALARRLQNPAEAVLAAWRARDALAGERVRWDGRSGVAAGVAADGALLVDTSVGRLSLDAGEVHLESEPLGAGDEPPAGQTSAGSA
ncbi:MAG TPA: biotin--[acetyl-CoA-carboxylase] ligase, partial [Thermoleophilaceae bacterium]|nr:biotin--[acetyl-CoA-carboxylase] ligase [Thermoleophilaceae bacterium]